SRIRPASGIRKVMAATPCTASPCWSDDAAVYVVRFGRHALDIAGHGADELHAARRKSGGVRRRRRPRRGVLCLHRLPWLPPGGAAGPDACAVGGFDRPDGPPAQYAAARRKKPRGGAELSRSGLSAARAGGARGLGESVCEVSLQ